MGVSSVDQTFQLFSECWLFRNLDRREKEALFTGVKIRDFVAGETIFVVGSPGDSGMILLDGTVQISLPGQPHAALLSSDDAWQHARQRRAVARRFVLELPPRGDH